MNFVTKWKAIAGIAIVACVFACTQHASAQCQNGMCAASRQSTIVSGSTVTSVAPVTQSVPTAPMAVGQSTCCNGSSCNGCYTNQVVTNAPVYTGTCNNCCSQPTMTYSNMQYIPGPTYTYAPAPTCSGGRCNNR